MVEEFEGRIKLKELIREQKEKSGQIVPRSITAGEAITENVMPEKDFEDKTEQWHEGAYHRKIK